MGTWEKVRRPGVSRHPHVGGGCVCGALSAGRAASPRQSGMLEAEASLSWAERVGGGRFLRTELGLTHLGAR